MSSPIHNTQGVDLSDGQVVDAFLRVAGDEGVSDLVVTLSGIRLSTQITVAKAHLKNAESRFFEHPDLRNLRAITSFSLVFATKQAGQVHVGFIRQPGKSPTLTITIPQAAADVPALATRLLIVTQQQGLAAPSVSEETRASDGAVLQALAEQVGSLREIVNVQARANETTRQELVKEFDQRRKQVDDELIERRAKLEAELEERWAVLEKELREKKEEADAREAEKTAELVAKEQALDERAKSLDLQGEREQRRMLRRDIQTAAKGMFEKPDLSPDAKMNFDRVATACKWIIGGSALFLFLALIGPVVIELAKDITLSAEMLALAWSVRVLAGIALVSCSVYYVRWLSTWSRQVTTNELRSKQFALDIDRASWLVEMALEYEKEGKTLNAGLIESFSRGLFEAEHKPSREQPSNSLLHLIRNAESLKVGAAGAELSLTGRQVQRADAQAAKDHEA